MSDALVIVVLAVILILGVMVLPQLMVRRAIPAVIRIFRQHSAVGVSSARAIHELGLAPPGMVERMWRMRDYKPRALQLLISAKIIERTEDGRLYLSEERLAATKWSGY